MERTALCCCGQLRIKVSGEPVRVSTCHCLQCQRRTGSVFSDNAYFNRKSIVAIEGKSNEFARRTDRGATLRFKFCPECGSTLHWDLPSEPDIVAIAVGSFADPGFPPPTRSVFGVTRHEWVKNPEGAEAFLAYPAGPRED